MGNRVGPLTSGDSFSNALHNNGFKLITADAYEKVYGFPSIFELVEDLQHSGESQCALDYRPLHPDILMCAAGIYQSMYGDDYGIQVFGIISFFCSVLKFYFFFIFIHSRF